MIEGDDMRKLRKGIRLLFELTKYWSAWICGKGMQIICKEYRNIWLIGERGREAGALPGHAGTGDPEKQRPCGASGTEKLNREIPV